MKVINSWKEIPEDLSEEELAEFWATHSLGPDLLKELKRDDEHETPPSLPRRR